MAGTRASRECPWERKPHYTSNPTSLMAAGTLMILMGLEKKSICLLGCNCKQRLKKEEMNHPVKEHIQ